MLERLLPSREISAEEIPVNIRQYAVVTDKTGRLLVLQFPAHYKGDAGNKWTLPGGGLLEKENPRAGIFRELSEETGLLCDLGRRVRVHRPRKSRDGLWVVYRGVVLESAVELSREQQAYAWVTEDELRASDFHHAQLQNMAVEMVGQEACGWDLKGGN